MPIKTTDVAAYFLAKAQEHGDLITHLKLQKLVYYAQAWYLALFDQLLFEEELQAWVHGPVAPSLYNLYKEYGWMPITEKVAMPDINEEKIYKHLDEVYEVFGGFTAFELERMTHEETPWINARGGIPNDIQSTNIINPDDMKNYYHQLIMSGNGAN